MIQKIILGFKFHSSTFNVRETWIVELLFFSHDPSETGALDHPEAALFLDFIEH
jgi:hypothetical protein